MKGLTAFGRVALVLTMLSTSVVCPACCITATVPLGAGEIPCNDRHAGPPPPASQGDLSCCPPLLRTRSPSRIVAAPSPGMAFLLPSVGLLAHRCRPIPANTIESRAGPPTALYLRTHRLLI